MPPKFELQPIKHREHLEREYRVRCVRAGGAVAGMESVYKPGDECPVELARWLWPGIKLDDFQADMIRSVFDPGVARVWVKGNTGCGKDAAAGMIVNLYFHAYEDARVILTSDSFDHCQQVLFGEVAKWRKRMRHAARLHDGGHLRKMAMTDSESHYVEIVNPDSDEGFSGRHGAHVLFVFDEASSIAEGRFRMADTQAKKLLAMANPRSLSGRFRRAFSACVDPNKTQTVLGPYGHERFITVGGLDCMNVREKRLKSPSGPIGGIDIDGVHYAHGEPIPAEAYQKVAEIIPGQTCYDTWMAHKSNPDPRWVEVFAHGRFPEEDPEKQVILGSWLDRHILAWRPGLPATAFSLDVAASAAGDETILAAGSATGVASLHAAQKADTMDTVAWVITTIRDTYGIELTHGDHPIVVDVVGVGKGPSDRLKELGCRVIEHSGNATPYDNRRYTNLRAEGYGELGLRLDPAGPFGETPFALPDDDKLRAELPAPEKIYTSDGFRFGITPKDRRPGGTFKGDTLKEKLGRSPDRADAVSMLYWIVRDKPMDDEPRAAFRDATLEEVQAAPDLRELMGEVQFALACNGAWVAQPGGDPYTKKLREAYRWEKRKDAEQAAKEWTEATGDDHEVRVVDRVDCARAQSR